MITTLTGFVRWVTDLLAGFGGFIFTLLEGIKALGRRPFRIRLIFTQLEFIGVNSTFIIILTGVFTGAVLALQSGKAFRLFNAEGVTGAVVALSLFRELGPVMASLMVAARCGSAMAAEIATMRVTQQIDALKVMSVDPIGYLISPRLLAGVVMVPMLTIVFCLLGMLGCYVICLGILGINEAVFFDKIEQLVEFEDITNALVKASVFGLIVSIVSCRKGYYASGGAVGVGRATTEAVVISSVSVLVADYFLTAFMF